MNYLKELLIYNLIISIIFIRNFGIILNVFSFYHFFFSSLYPTKKVTVVLTFQKTNQPVTNTQTPLISVVITLGNSTAQSSKCATPFHARTTTRWVVLLVSTALTTSSNAVKPEVRPVVMGVHQYRCDDSIICYDDYMVVMYI